MKMLQPISNTAATLSRRNVLWLSAAAALAMALPTFHSASAAEDNDKPIARVKIEIDVNSPASVKNGKPTAEEEKPAPTPKKSASVDEPEKKGSATQAARHAYEATLKEYYTNGADIEAVYRWSCRWMKVEGGTPAFKSHLDRMQGLCDNVAERHKRGAVGGDDTNLAAARYYVWEAREMLKSVVGLHRDKKPPEAAKTPTPRHDKEIAAWQRNTWQMQISLDAPNLDPPAAQFAILDHEPLATFNAYIERMHNFNRKQIEKAENAELKKIQRKASMCAAWDSGFKDVTGDRLYLLTSALGTGHCISSNGPDGKKWIVTKTVQIDGKLVCWCLPVQMKRGELVDVTLTEQNAFDLDKAYDDAMKAAEQKKKEPNGAKQPPKK